MTEVEAEVRRFIATVVPTSDERAQPALDLSLTRSGLLGSIDVVELVVFLEGRFGIQILDRETVPENFDTIRSITRFVGSKIANGRQPHSPDAGDSHSG